MLRVNLSLLDSTLAGAFKVLVLHNSPVESSSGQLSADFSVPES